MNEIPKFFKHPEKFIDQAHRYAIHSGVNFFKESFRRQGWLDHTLDPWKKRVFDVGKQRAILVQSGRLRDSIHAVSTSPNRVVYSTDSLPYAVIHNEGGFITVTARMKRYFWAMYAKSGGAKSKSSLTQFYKAMALKKVGSKIRIPKRQYMGESATLMAQFDAWVAKQIEKIFSEE